jgi:hypothetical protein
MPDAYGSIARVKHYWGDKEYIYIGRHLGSGWYSACLFCKVKNKKISNISEPVYIKVRGKYHKELIQDEYGFTMDESYWTFEHKNIDGSMYYITQNKIPSYVLQAAQEIGLLEA